jgi:hypothetical protein
MGTKGNKLTLTITHGSENRELHLQADTMNEMVEKIIDWQTMGSGDKEYFEKKGKLEKELKSGWYYINNN